MIVVVIFIVSHEAPEFIAGKRVKKPSIVIYRDVSSIVHGYTTM
jgi:hypothetical protein